MAQSGDRVGNLRIDVTTQFHEHAQRLQVPVDGPPDERPEHPTEPRKEIAQILLVRDPDVAIRRPCIRLG